MHVLIVEDHLGIRQTLEMFLELEGHTAVGVDRGELGLIELATGAFDLILLDMNTEGISPRHFMDGLAELERRAGFRRPAVIVLSAAFEAEAEARRIGADFSVRKPFAYEDLLLRIQQIQGRGLTRSYSGIHSDSSSEGSTMLQ